MSYFLTEEQEAVRDLARRFVQKEVAPRALEVHGAKSQAFIKEMGRKMADLGFLRLGIPESAGGMGVSKSTMLLLYEELGKECPALGIHLLLNGVFSATLLAMPAAHDRWFEKVMSGEAIMSASGTDPRGSANVGSWSDLAVQDGDDFVLNGSKSYCSGSPYASLIIVFGLHKGSMWAFPIEAGQPGFTVREDRTMGISSAFGALTMSDVRIPVAECLQLKDWYVDGKPVSEAGMSGDTVLEISAISLGIAQGAFEKALAYARERTIGGSPVLTLGALQVKFAKMKAQIEAIRNMLYNVARLVDEGREDRVLHHMVKPLATDMAVDVARDCIQIFGGAGYCIDTGIERYLRDAMGLVIGEGSNDMHWSTVAALMKMPGARPGAF